MTIPLVLICDDNFVMQTCVAITSIMKNKNDSTNYKIYVIMAECSQQSKKYFSTWSNVCIKEVSLEKYKHIKQLAHISIACLLKFDMSDIVNEHDKFIYLDGDIIVKEDLSDMYNIPLCDNHLGGCPGSFIDSSTINCGIMLVNAKKMRDDNMGEKLFAIRKSYGDKPSMDQQTINNTLNDSILRISRLYNIIPQRALDAAKEFGISKLNFANNWAFKTSGEILSSAKIIHFATNEKPWKYSFVPCGDLWYDFYLQSPFKDVELKRKNYLQAKATNIVNIVKNKGVKALFVKVINKISNKKTSTNWNEKI